MRKAYPSDLTDEQWAIIEPLIPIHRVGRPREVSMREVLNTIFYQVRSGCQWDMLPHDLLAQEHRLRPLRPAGATTAPGSEILDALRQEVRVAAGREPSPSAASIDSQIGQGDRDRRQPGRTTGARRSPGGNAISSWT